jgi:hypothetical protein
VIVEAGWSAPHNDIAMPQNYFVTGSPRLGRPNKNVAGSPNETETIESASGPSSLPIEQRALALDAPSVA